ncbi:MAB_1171c family putative transporter [Streptomyces sp. NPDC048723]|uniref:MAB_1171c family putative transporter n=1 Tax=Streptomyces sp. NPDC048723 TaxID=3365589 RepID=UPI0037197834
MIVYTLTAVIGLVFAAALAWKVFQIIKAPHDAPLRAVTLCLVSAAASFVLAMPPFAARIQAVGGAGAPRLVQNLFVLSMAYWLMCFYLYSAADRADRSRRVRKQTLILALAALGLALMTAAVGTHHPDANFRGLDLRDPALASFYLIANLYLVYALTTALRWTCVYARASRRPLATGLWLAAGGIGSMAVACAIRTVLTVVRWQGGAVPRTVVLASSLIVAAAVPLFLVGVSYPGIAMRIAALRLRRHHRLMYHRLGPLWELLHEAYPEDALDRVQSPRWRDRLHPRGVHRRYYRRVIECRDGLVRISPSLAPAGDGARACPQSPDDLADQLYAALRRRKHGEPAPAQAIAVAIPHTQSLEDDVRQLVQLSDALAERLCVRGVPADQGSNKT